MSSTEAICPVCDQGKLSVETYTDEIPYNGKNLQVSGLECCHCPDCGAKPILTEQIRRNQVRICDAKRKAEGFLTGEQIRSIREGLGLSQPQAALLFGGGANAFSKYERGEVIQSQPMDRLLRCAAAHPPLLGYLSQLAGIEYAAPVYCSKGRSQPLTDPNYTSRQLSGEQVVVSSSTMQVSNVVLLRSSARTRAA